MSWGTEVPAPQHIRQGDEDQQWGLGLENGSPVHVSTQGGEMLVEESYWNFVSKMIITQFDLKRLYTTCYFFT